MQNRPPIIVIVGHIDHGKSTLLDYIRSSNIVAGEAGGITQHTSAYEVVHKTKDGKTEKITFLDTPGHEAFTTMRDRGAQIADIAVLIVSAEDGVKAQTLEALKSIKAAEVPYIVAITKIDKPNANVERVKQNLGEHEVYIEEYGGKVPCVPISSKTGDGVSDLLDMMLLVAELEELTGDATKPAEGFVLEARLDSKAGIMATLVITNGTVNTGDYIVVDGAAAKIKKLEDFGGNIIKTSWLTAGTGLIMPSECPNYFGELIIAQDATVEFEVMPKSKDLWGRVYECVVPVIYEENAFCTLTTI